MSKNPLGMKPDLDFAHSKLGSPVDRPNLCGLDCKKEGIRV